MIAFLADLMFRCPHRRLTRPITPVSKPGEAGGDTYVVCLECGKQFYYDWENMRQGGPVERDAAKGVLPPNLPKPSKSKLKYALLGSAIPLAVLVGKALLSQPGAPKSRKPGPGPDQPSNKRR